MKNKFPLLLLILVNFVCVDIFAQVSSMSDSQVMDFVIKENEKGTSRDEIVKKLIERDVPIQQIQRIKKKYEKQLNNKQVGAKNLESDKVTNSRNRTYKNFDEKPENKENFQRRSNKKVNQSELTENQKKILNSKREDNYDNEIDFMLPDSTELFNDALGFNKRKKTKVIFGHNIFNNNNLTFEPNMNIATPIDNIASITFISVNLIRTAPKRTRPQPNTSSNICKFTAF